MNVGQALSECLRSMPNLVQFAGNGRISSLPAMKHCKPPTRHTGPIARAQAEGKERSGRAVKLRVERQTHLPATRSEAWKALESLMPKDEWPESALVFAAIESIYRAECQKLGEVLQEAYRIANDALEEIPAFEDLPARSRQKADISGSLPSVDRQSVDAFKNSRGAAGTSQVAAESNDNGDHHQSRDGPGHPNPRSSVNGPRQDASGTTTSSICSEESSGSSQSNSDGSKSALSEGIDIATSKASSALQQMGTVIQEEVEHVGETKDDPVAGEAASHSAARLAFDTDRVDQSEVLSNASVDFESASRLEYDRNKRGRVNLNDVMDPQQADQAFMSALIPLLRKAHFVHLSSRDEGLAKSLNADYVAQLFISPDTRRLDADLVKPSIQCLDVPEQAEAMLVFKRGYGQARRKGRMLVAKLDYLQYVAVRAFFNNVAARAKFLWRSIRNNRTSSQPHRSHGQERMNVVDTEKGKIKPTDGRMPSTTSKPGRAAPALGNRSIEPVLLQSIEDEGLWNILQQTARRVGEQLSDWGVLSPRFLLAGGGLFMTLSNWGLLPQVDVEPLSNFKEAWKPDEPERLEPVHVERVSLQDALAARRGLSVKNMLGTVELIEPTFQELLVLYRHAPEPEWLAPLRRKVLGPSNEERTPRYRRRNKIYMRVFRDVPLPTWKIVFPDKLLQFRPLDGLRADLLSVAGLAAFVAQAKYDSVILELITLSSAVVLLVRVVLGYKRMYDRFEQMANEMLAETTIAGQDGVIEYVANSAALQQFEQTSLAYLMLRLSEENLNADDLCLSVENLLEQTFQVKVRFDAAEALSELERLGLAYQGSKGYIACCPTQAFQKLEQHWAGLLLPAYFKDSSRSAMSAAEKVA